MSFATRIVPKDQVQLRTRSPKLALTGSGCPAYKRHALTSKMLADQFFEFVSGMQIARRTQALEIVSAHPEELSLETRGKNPYPPCGDYH